MSDSLQAIVKDMATQMAVLAASHAAAQKRSGAVGAVHTAALQALFLSHPDRAALKTAWDEKISELWAMSGSLAAADLTDPMKQMQDILEHAFR